MSIHTHKMVNGEMVKLTKAEIAEIETQEKENVSFVAPQPTKEQLLAELQALTAKIQALE